MKNKFKSIILFFLNIVANIFYKKNKAVILLYHSIDKNDVYLTLKPDIFIRQMNYLKERDYKIISLANLCKIIESNKEIEPKTVVLTFDDGFLSHYKNVFPILKKCNFPATFFISTSLVGKNIDNIQKKPQLSASWDQLIEMSKSLLIDIEPHGINHLELDVLSTDELHQQIIESKKEIEYRLNKKCVFFAPPRGKYNKKVIDLVKGYGFEAMLTIEEGAVDGGGDLFALKRNTIDSSCVNMIQFRARLGQGIVLFNKLMFRG